MSQKTTVKYLEENPRMIGVLFFVGLIVLETGNAAANAASAVSGP
ncbi:DUF7503 family protein [Haladaptatus halobius]